MATNERYKLHLKEIPQGEFEEVYRLDDDFFRERSGFELLGGEVFIKLHGVRTCDVYEVFFTLDGEVDTLCTRCENRLRYPLKGEFHMVIKLGAENSSDEDEEIIVSRDNPTLSIDDLLYSFVVLSMPLRRVHPAGECDQEVEKYLNQQEETIPHNPFEALLHSTNFDTE
ncbi:hypothetical protein HMPREF1869_01650 [Bacteroidales bacterium KA00251]|nr:hypothetical protein HMPREF1869_01650 [Bacteroidales bacterium KA00251]